MDPGSRVEQEGTDPGCTHSKRFTELAVPPISEYLWQPVMHSNCIANQIVAVRNRILAKMPQPTADGLQRLSRTARKLSKLLPSPCPEPLGQFAMQYTGAKRARYLAAAELVKRDGIDRRHAGITMFVKSERMDPTAKINPDPRPIQFRDARYCVALASYLKPLEHALYNMKTSKFPNLGPTRLVGKGLNQSERANILRRKWERFAKPCCFGIDASRFDQHVSKALLKIEHAVYRSRYNSPELDQLLSWQLENKCSSRLGLRYVTNGRRMSGDMNTALGNCVLMLAMAITVYGSFGVPYDLFDDGDDCLVLCDASHAPQLIAATKPMFLDFGMEMKIESVAYDFAQISWCQSSPIKTDVGWKFVRSPIKTMSCALTSTKWAGMTELMRKQYLAGIADCELILNQGVPVLWEYAKALKRNSQGAKARYFESDGEYIRYLRERKVKQSICVTTEARFTFEQAFGIPIDQQLAWEKALSTWHFTVKGLRTDIGSRCPWTWENIRTS